MHRSRRPNPLLVAATVVGLLLAGCGGDEDVDPETFADQLYERTGEDETIVPREVVDCITDLVFEEWADDQAEINRIYRAADEDELGNETRDRLALFNQQCFETYLEGVREDGAETPADESTEPETPADESTEPETPADESTEPTTDDGDAETDSTDG